MVQKMVRSGLAMLALVTVAGLVGCSDDELTGGPDVDLEQVCSVVVDVEPDALEAPWTLTGPREFSETGNGDALFEKMVPGRYEITFGPVADWNTPAPMVRQVRGTKRGFLAGRYTTSAGTYPVDFVDVDVDVANPGDALELQYTFMMGSPAPRYEEDDEGNLVLVDPGEPGRSFDEVQHPVRLQSAFVMAATEITNGQYMAAAQWALDNGHAVIHWDEVRDVLTLRTALDGSSRTLVDLKVDPALTYDLETGLFGTSHPDLPVTAVSWYGAAAYCDWLSMQEGLTRAYDHSNWRCNGGAPYAAQGYRLPTEAEWEHACRAGSPTAFSNGGIMNEACGDTVLAQVAWFCGNNAEIAGDRAGAVASVPPREGETTSANAFDLYDMHGNVWEWCNDLAGDYPEPVLDPDDNMIPVVDPTGALAADSTTRVMRGGAFRNTAANCRSARRQADMPAVMYDTVGFRPVRTTDAR